MDYQEVLNFWFQELTFEDWFQGGEALDETIRERFGEALVKARAGEFASWRDTIQGRLAEIIVLDQFSRNAYRDQGKAFYSDDMALALAQEAVSTGKQYDLTDAERSFLYMPFMHSESLYIQKEYSMKYFKEEGLEENLKYAKEHCQTIEKFGRFPYRNEALGRQTTPEEQEYLDQK